VRTYVPGTAAAVVTAAWGRSHRRD